MNHWARAYMNNGSVMCAGFFIKRGAMINAGYLYITDLEDN